jgi:hypothetical protein
MIYSLVIPELQQRGRYKTEYATGSLRNKLFAQGDHLPASILPISSDVDP